ncbi:MAG: TolC family protein, partial [Bacteroidaceae bacterium]|nr:TolC family protein [Bacteroidaceae bacterium]
MKKTILTTFALALFALGGNAQTFTLSQCLKKGLENNYSLRITRNEEEVAHNNATAANAGYMPTIDLAAGYNGSIGGNSSKQRTTGEIEKSGNSFDNNVSAGVDVNWTIFNGFKTKTTYEQLKEMEKMGETGTRLAIEDFIADLTAEYYNFLQQRMRLHNYYNAVLLSKERLRIVEERYNIGNFSRL